MPSPGGLTGARRKYASIFGADGRVVTGAEQFNGMIDDVRIYNRALSQTEILNDMLGGPPYRHQPEFASGTLHASQAQQFIATITGSSNTGSLGRWLWGRARRRERSLES